MLNIVKIMMQNLGYTVLDAGTPEKAVSVAKQHDGAIDLVVTDVIMPGINGRELVARLTADRPDLKSLYLSGYTDDLVARHGVLQNGMHFIQKPFSLGDFSAKMRVVLGRE